MDSFELKEKAAVAETSGDIGNGKEGGASHVTNEKAILLDRQRRLSLRSAVKFRYAAIIVSWISVTTSLVLGVGSIVFAWKNDSQSLFSFGLDALLDCISSIIILWRYHGGGTLYSDERERRACIFIGILFLLSACLLATKSITALVRSEITEQPYLALIIAGVNIGVCLFLGTGKIYIGHKLESRALVTDSVTTLTGAVMSIFTLIFSSVYQRNKSLWYLDDAFGIFFSVFLAVYGTRVLYVSISEGRKAVQKDEIA